MLRLLGKLAYNLKDWDKIAVGKLINLLKDSEGCQRRYG
jgi:hypothetical protein